MPGTTTVRPTGEIDIWTAPDLRQQWLALAATEKPDMFVVDLTEVAFLDSTGIGTLVRLRTAPQEHSGSVAVRGANPMIVKILKLTGLSSTFPDAGQQP